MSARPVTVITWLLGPEPGHFTDAVMRVAGGR